MSGGGSFLSGLAGGYMGAAGLDERKKMREALENSSRSRGVLDAATYSPSESETIADEAMLAIGKPEMAGGRDEFINAMMPHAMRASKETGLDPRLIIAQSAQETGWGKHAPGNNYFGIKSHGKSGGNTLATNEVVNGKTVRVNDSFRGYGSMGESVDGYASFLKENPRYRSMLAASDLDGQLSALGRSGYATDPNYAQSVGAIARSISMPQTTEARVAPTAGESRRYERSLLEAVADRGKDLFDSFYQKKG